MCSATLALIDKPGSSRGSRCDGCLVSAKLSRATAGGILSGTDSEFAPGPAVYVRGLLQSASSGTPIKCKGFCDCAAFSKLCVLGVRRARVCTQLGHRCVCVFALGGLCLLWAIFGRLFIRFPASTHTAHGNSVQRNNKRYRDLRGNLCHISVCRFAHGGRRAVVFN